MSELTAKQIKEQLSRYLTGDLEPAEFRDWFALVLRDAHKSSDPHVEELAHSIEWALCDLERDATPEQVRDNLTAIAAMQPVVFVYCGDPTQNPSIFFHQAVSTGTSATLEVPASAAIGFVGAGRVVEYAS
jgi:hypothetical protein